MSLKSTIFIMSCFHRPFKTNIYGGFFSRLFSDYHLNLQNNILIGSTFDVTSTMQNTIVLNQNNKIINELIAWVFLRKASLQCRVTT